MVGVFMREFHSAGSQTSNLTSAFGVGWVTPCTRQKGTDVLPAPPGLETLRGPVTWPALVMVVLGIETPARASHATPAQAADPPPKVSAAHSKATFQDFIKASPGLICGNSAPTACGAQQN